MGIKREDLTEKDGRLVDKVGFEYIGVSAGGYQYMKPNTEHNYMVFGKILWGNINRLSRWDQKALTRVLERALEMEKQRGR